MNSPHTTSARAPVVTASVVAGLGVDALASAARDTRPLLSRIGRLS